PFWPDQLFKDMVAIAVVFAALVGINIMTEGVKLDGPADPASNFDARPEWYFRALFQILKYFEGTMEHIVALGTPVVVGAVLLGLPFVDRGDDRSPRARLPYLGVLAVGGALVALFTFLSFQEDASDEQLQKRLAAAHAEGLEARRLAKEYGVPTAGGLAVYTTAPGYRVDKLWTEHCAACHVGDEREGPEIIAGYNSRQWIEDFLRDPNGPRFFGVTGINDMEPVELEPGPMADVVEFIYAQTGAADIDAARVKRGQAVFEDECTACHPSTIPGETELPATDDDWVAPHIVDRGSLDNLALFIRDAGRPEFFGPKNEMPEFGRNKISEDDRYLRAEYIISLRNAGAAAGGSPGASGRPAAAPPAEPPAQDAPSEGAEGAAA
ncbi:MAG: c-type cytochrome, partial [Myxococcota bacterium]